MGDGHVRSQWDSSSPILGALTLQWKFNHEPLKGSRDKERPRAISVHPELASALQWWQAEGSEAFVGRKPRPEDPIIPNVHKVLKQENGGFHTGSSIDPHARQGLEAAELDLEWKAHHACRHAFITTTPLWRRAGLGRAHHPQRGRVDCGPLHPLRVGATL